MNVRRFPDRDALNVALAQRLREAVESAGTGAVMLSGGHAPRPAYAALGREALRPGEGLHVLYSDERYVPATSDASNFHASGPLLKALGLPPERVLRVRTELPLEAAARDYERQLAAFFEGGGRIGLGLLGMGADGHTASLFTEADLARAHGRLAIAVLRRDGMEAVSVTPGVLNRVERVLMVVVGVEKKEALARFLARDSTVVAWRAVEGCGEVDVWCEMSDARMAV